MSLDRNCQGDGTGECLLHFTPCATPCSSGINVFAQSLLSDHNLYVSLPFILIILPNLKSIPEQDSFCIHIPGLEAYTFLFWALLQSLAVDGVLLGRRNEDGVLLFPSQVGQH